MDIVEGEWREIVDRPVLAPIFSIGDARRAREERLRQAPPTPDLRARARAAQRRALDHFLDRPRLSRSLF